MTLGIQPNRSSSSIGFGISIIIIFIYYTLMTLAGAYQQKAQHYNRYKWRKQNEFRSCNLSGSIGIFSQSLPFHLIVSP